MAEELLETRRLLESYIGEFYDLKEPVLQAQAEEDAIPMSLTQARSTIASLDALLPVLKENFSILTRREMDETQKAEDAENKKKILKEFSRTRQEVVGIKYFNQASQNLITLDKDISRIEKSQAENPHKDYSKAISPITKDMVTLKLLLTEYDIISEDPIWDRCSELNARLVELQGHVVTKESDVKPYAKKPYKMAPLSIPTFDGKIENWTHFWEEYEQAIDTNKEWDNCTKLVYLKQAIQDAELKAVISDLGIEADVYPIAIKLLKSRFDKPRILHKQICEEIKSLTGDSYTRSTLASLAHKLQNVVRRLKRLKLLGVSELLTSMAELCMSKELLHEWNNATTKLHDPPPVDELITFIREKADQAEGEAKVVSVKPPVERNKFKQKNRGSHAAVAPPSSAPTAVPKAAPATQPTRAPHQGARLEYPPCKYSCPLCPDNHYPYHCSVFKGYTARQRIDHVKTHTLCTTCLKPGHAASVCMSTFKCKTCRAAHNTLLHEDQINVSAPATALTNAATPDPTEALKDTLLMTAEVLLTGTNGLTITARAFLDAGSNLSIVSHVTRNTLALRSTGNSVRIDGVGGEATSDPSPLVRVTVSSNYKKNWKKDLTVAVMARPPTRDIPIQSASETKTLSHLQGLALADPDYDKPGCIDILLGQDIWDELFLSGRIKGPQGTPSAWHTVFGWVVTGLYVPDAPSLALTASAFYVASHKANVVSDDLLSKFWLLEEPPKQETEFSPEEARVEKHYKDTHQFIKAEGRYQVTLPRTLGDLKLRDSRNQALHRARCNEKSLIRRNRYSAFQDVMADYINLGHARLVSPQDLLLPSESTYYMPVHSVVKESSSSTKIRAVFDASAATSTKVSLNDLLAVGPTLQPSLDRILMKFRIYSVAISGDICKMYREILLAPEDCTLHRFIWRKNLDEPWQDYEMRRVTFGVTSSPYVAIKTLQQAANDFGKDYPTASHHIKHNFYVDDFFGGAATAEDAITLTREISTVLNKAGFTIKKWRSSHSQVLKSIPSEHQEVVPSQDLVDLHAAGYPKALGLLWDSRKDEMATQVEIPNSYSSTKRGVVSDVAKTFDVLGWLAPVILVMKILYRELWILKLDWDQQVPEELKKQHDDWRQNLILLANVRLSRCYFSRQNPKDITLQGFSDASKNAFSAVVYVRANYASGPPSTALVLAKTRVAPLDRRSIPELELCGAHLLAKILTVASQTLDVSIKDVKAYTDSTIVLSWLDGSPKRNKLYVANRICKVMNLLPAKTWGYAPSQENPADCASRGISATELLNHSLWWHGPPWLQKQPLCPLVFQMSSRKWKQKRILSHHNFVMQLFNIMTAG